MAKLMKLCFTPLKFTYLKDLKLIFLLLIIYLLLQNCYSNTDVSGSTKLESCSTWVTVSSSYSVSPCPTLSKILKLCYYFLLVCFILNH